MNYQSVFENFSAIHYKVRRYCIIQTNSYNQDCRASIVMFVINKIFVITTLSIRIEIKSDIIILADTQESHNIFLTYQDIAY